MAAPALPSIKIGDYSVTAFSDGMFQTTIDVTVGVDKAMTQKLSGKSLDEPVYLSVNAFLVEGRGVRALVDAGSGDTMGSALGKLPDNLRAAGIGLDTITHVLLTHIHPDHSNGLIDGAGAEWFPKAEVVVQEDEIKFWFDRDISQAAHDRQRNNMINAKKSPGHTPGHNTWTIEGGNDALIIWGDTIHMAFMQLARPDIAFVFDTDPALAVASRVRLLDQVSVDHTRIAGMHLDFPGYGYVKRRDGRYFIEAE
jgi:glyoxylase-like metal-dependent hydrolase (beta-lactamase superfamily II)